MGKQKSALLASTVMRTGPKNLLPPRKAISSAALKKMKLSARNTPGTNCRALRFLYAGSPETTRAKSIAPKLLKRTISTGEYSSFRNHFTEVVWSDQRSTGIITSKYGLKFIEVRSTGI